MPPITLTADRRDHGQTLAAVLKKRLGVPWSKAKQTIERRHVRVSGQIVADAAFRVKNGKRITIAAGALEGATVPRRTAAQVTPQKSKTRLSSEVAARIVYFDDDVVVVDKPAGLTTQRNRGEAKEFGRGQRFLPQTLADQLPRLLGEPRAKIFAVHRLDRDTSGLVVFARTKAAAKHLAKQFKTHRTERVYLALVRGVGVSQRIESLIVEDRGDGRRGSGPDGKRAVTHVTLRKQVDGLALVECRLETGRTHQVRIHLGEAGTPLCGERIYDRPVHGAPLADRSGAARPMLHAAVLGFEHPASGEVLLFESEPPRDFTTLLASFAKS